MSFKPMLSATVTSIKSIPLPAYITPKLDGIRCLIKNGKAVSRSLKDIPNKFIQVALSGLPDGLDGELLLQGNKPFNEVSSAIMSQEGTPDFRYVVFDYFKFPHESYVLRMQILSALTLNAWCKVLMPTKIKSLQELVDYEEKWVTKGFEGVMIRSEGGPYKFGRSTERESYLLKLKRFKDSDAEILGMTAMFFNENQAEKNALGYAERSLKKEGLVKANTMGALKVRDLKTGLEFSVGTGFTEAQRQDFWDNRDKYIGKIIKYKFQPSGSKDKPRFPGYIGIRHKNDL